MSDEAILRNLLSGSGQRDSAWKKFLDQYSNLFLKIIWQFEKDHDQAMETYLYICQRVSANDFAVLRQFQRDYHSNPPRFTTWLYAVTRNMCIDSYRATKGRRQIPRTIQRMSKLDRKVFTLYYWKGLSRDEVENTLKNHDHCSSAAIQESLERVTDKAERLPEISRRHDWKPVFVPFIDDQSQVDPTESPIEESELLAWLEGRLAGLSTQDRLILRLYFWDEMSGAEIAKALRISPQQRVYYLLKKALAYLRDGVQ